MLNLYLGGRLDGTIFNADMYFNNVFSPEWLESDLAKQMVQDIDKSAIVNGHCIESPVFGMIPPERLSGGVKVLLTMLNEPETIAYITNCGNNCANWILKISELHDITACLTYAMHFEDIPMNIKILNNGKIVKTREELYKAYIEFL